MSAGSQSTRCRDIPAVRRVAILDAAHMPHDYSTTPGGTMFSTTPGGKSPGLCQTKSQFKLSGN
uniref:Uncharacterized protein n=1 Tax=Neogobius melanostomus TaxID=47308 RepID=A0A8C6V0I9_9GOBI